MAREYAVIFKENLPVPLSAFTYEGFQDWVFSDDFPDTGRIDFVAGDVEVEMSPEDLYTHGVVKTAVVMTLGDLIVRTDVGDVFTDSTRVTSRFAQLSAEPDVVMVFRETLENGRVRLVLSTSREADRYLAIEGAPDLVVEVVSERDEIGRQPSENLIACGACRRFETVTSRYCHTHDCQRDRMRLAERTAKCGEAAGSGIDLMIYVQRRELEVQAF